MSKKDVTLPIEQTSSEPSAQMAQPSFLQTRQRLLLGIWGGLVILIILALAGIFVTKSGIDFILPLLGVLLVMMFALVTIVNASFAWQLPRGPDHGFTSRLGCS